MTDYQKAEDLENVPQLVALAPVEAKAFLACNHACERRDGMIAPKYRELISLAVALTTQCAYCLDVHSKAAQKAEATREELAEVAMIAAAVLAMDRSPMRSWRCGASTGMSRSVHGSRLAAVISPVIRRYHLCISRPLPIIVRSGRIVCLIRPHCRGR